VLQWDQSPALPDFVLIRPSGAPGCVISAIRRDTEVFRKLCKIERSIEALKINQKEMQTRRMNMGKLKQWWSDYLDFQ
ncbi:hypothetical protein Goari_014076, partial [Gossypium aridum]|nr:hypothetical protein [Gossypium aridum]